MNLYQLDLTVLIVRGHAEHFLNGLTSNSLDQPYNAFLNQHGRIIATFSQVRVNDDEIAIVVSPLCVEELLNHVSRYARLSKTTIEHKDRRIYFDLDGNYPVAQDDWIIEENAGRLIITTQAYPAHVSNDQFTLFRLQHEIPLQGIDYQSDTMILNVHEYRYVSYTKGCFLGQEPVSKVHNRSKPSRKLVVQYADQLSQEEQLKMTSIVTEPESGRVKGFLFMANP